MRKARSHYCFSLHFPAEQSGRACRIQCRRTAERSARNGAQQVLSPTLLMETTQNPGLRKKQLTKHELASKRHGLGPENGRRLEARSCQGQQQNSAWSEDALQGLQFHHEDKPPEDKSGTTPFFLPPFPHPTQATSGEITDP